MPFGKFRGWDVEAIETPYLEWLAGHIELREPLRSVVYNALSGRSEITARPTENVIKTTYRELAMKWHPDHGGTKEAMQAVNEFYEKLSNAS